MPKVQREGPERTAYEFSWHRRRGMIEVVFPSIHTAARPAPPRPRYRCGRRGQARRPRQLKLPKKKKIIKKTTEILFNLVATFGNYNSLGATWLEYIRGTSCVDTHTHTWCHGSVKLHPSTVQRDNYKQTYIYPHIYIHTFT